MILRPRLIDSSLTLTRPRDDRSSSRTISTAVAADDHISMVVRHEQFFCCWWGMEEYLLRVFLAPLYHRVDNTTILLPTADEYANVNVNVFSFHGVVVRQSSQNHVLSSIVVLPP